MRLFPHVKFRKEDEEAVFPRRVTRVSVPPGIANEAVAILTGKDSVTADGPDRADVILREAKGEIARICNEQGVETPALSDELYCIDIQPDRVIAHLASARAAYPALATLGQLLGQDEVRCGIIVDWPVKPIRSAHLLKGMVPLKKRLFEVLEALAQFKINQVVLEYEAKLGYRDNPDIALPTAYTPAEAGEIVAYAEMLGMEVVPLLQCVGHMAHVLEADRYAHLRESEKTNEWCMTNPGSLILFKRLAEETFTLHPNSRFYHIGGDECLRAPACRECREAMARLNMTRPVYLAHYLNKCAAVVREYGKRPIIWSDIVESHPEMCDVLDKDIVMMTWDYRSREQVATEFLFRAGAKQTSQWQGYDILHRLPESALREYRAFLLTDSFPSRIRAFPFVDYFAEKGFDVMGGANATSQPYAPAGDMQHGRNLSNISAWSEKAGVMKHGSFLGVCTTFWSAGQLGISLPCLAAGGIGYWQGSLEEDVTFLDSIPYRQRTRQWVRRSIERATTANEAVRRFYGQVSSACSKRNRALLGGEALCINLGKYVNAPIWEDFAVAPKPPAKERLSYKPYLQYRGFPEGRREMLGVPFELSGRDRPGEIRRIALKNKIVPELPAQVKVDIATKAASIWFLHSASDYPTVGESAVGRYEVMYSDGEFEEIPIVIGQTVLDWYRPLPTGKLMVGWDDGDYLGITLFAWRNPHPDKTVEAIRLVSNGTVSVISVFGITLGKTEGDVIDADQAPLVEAYEHLVSCSDNYLQPLSEDYRVHEGYLEGYAIAHLRKETMWLESLADKKLRGCSLGTVGRDEVARLAR